MTEQQELEAVLKYLNVTEKEFFEIMEVAYKKVIKKRVEADRPARSLEYDSRILQSYPRFSPLRIWQRHLHSARKHFSGISG